jgi:hypothetical protein
MHRDHERGLEKHAWRVRANPGCLMNKVERAPGLAPGKSGFAIRRLDGFGIARF